MGRFGAGNKFAAKRKAEALAKVARIRSRKIPKVETGNAASSVLVDKTNTTNGGTPRLAAAQEIASAQSAASLSAAAQQSAQLGDDRGTSTAVTSLAGVSSSTSTAHTLTEATVFSTLARISSRRAESVTQTRLCGCLAPKAST